MSLMFHSSSEACDSHSVCVHAAAEHNFIYRAASAYFLISLATWLIMNTVKSVNCSEHSPAGKQDERQFANKLDKPTIIILEYFFVKLKRLIM